MEISRRVRMGRNPFCVALIGTSFMAITVGSAIIAYSAYTKASYISTHLSLLRSPYSVLGFMLSFLSVLITIALVSFMCAMSSQDVLSKVWKKFLAGMGVLTILTFLMCIWSVTVIDSRDVRDTESSLKHAIITYNLDISNTRAMDAIQSELKCCGIHGYEDWKNNFQYDCASKETALKCKIPPSCCRTKQDKIPYDDYCGHGDDLFEMGKMENRVIPSIPDDILMHTGGCLPATEETLRKSGRTILIYIIILLIIQSYSMVVLFCVHSHLKSSNERNTAMNNVRLNNRRRPISQGYDNEAFELTTVNTDGQPGVNEDPGPSTSTHVFCRDHKNTQSRFLAPHPTYRSPFKRTVHFENDQIVQNLLPVEGAMGHEDTVP